MKPLRRSSKSSSNELETASKSQLLTLETNLRTKLVTYVADQSIENPAFLPIYFKSFESQCGIEACEFFRELFSRQEQHQLLSGKDKNISNALLKAVNLCFTEPSYHPNQDDMTTWFKLFILHLDAHREIPDFFCQGEINIKFLSLLDLQQVETIVTRIKEFKLSESLYATIIDRLLQKQDAGLAVKLLTCPRYSSIAHMIQSIDETAYYFSLLTIKRKAVDFALLSKPEFRKFMATMRTNAVGCLLYDQLLERVKQAFYYENLPEGYSDVRQTTAGQDLLQRNRGRVEAEYNYNFLSYSEVLSIFSKIKPIQRLKQGEKWLDIYKKNLLILLNCFFPYIHLHLDEISEMYKQYRQCTIAITASQDNDRYNSEKHRLEALPTPITQYIKKQESELTKFNANIDSLAKLYSSMQTYDTIRMKDQEMLGFISIERVAHILFNSLPCEVIKFTELEFSQKLSIHLVKQFSKMHRGSAKQPVLHGRNTETNVAEHQQLLWFRNYLLPTFEEGIKQISEKLKDSKGSFAAFTEDHLLSLVKYFCAQPL